MQHGKRYPTSCFRQDNQVIYSVLTISVRELHIFQFHPKCVFTHFLVNNNIIHS